MKAFRSSDISFFLRVAILSSIAILQTAAAPNRVMARAAWEEIVINVAGGGSASLSFEYLPSNEYPVLIELFKEWDALPQQSLDDVEAYWKKHGPKDRDMTAADIEYIRRTVKSGPFMTKNREAIDRLQKAAGDNLFTDLLAMGIVDRKAPATFVFVPLPCPSRPVYQQASDFIKAAADVAVERKLAVVVVRSYYGDENSIRNLKEGKWWNDDILKMPAQYAKFVDAGVLKFCDRFPGSTTTPWGYLFRGGEYILSGNAAVWADRPLEVLKEFKGK